MIVATAGHVDHGKTTLVRALTGVDTDRLEEEKRRGMSIDLGFAYADLGVGEPTGFVDVPGHERFLRNMLAGVAAIDFALLVVAADDGPMPQTREHLAILRLLGVARGAVALTKVDRVLPERVAEARAELDAVLAATPLARAPVFEVAAPSGLGVEALREHLAAQERATAAAAPGGGFRLAVDRAFSVSGSGLVVTGAVFAGEARVGDLVQVFPSGGEARVRAIHAQGRPATVAHAGQRCALNLAGLGSPGPGRGDWIVAPQVHAPTDRLDVEIEFPGSVPATLRRGAPVQLHHGSAAVSARIALLESREPQPGDRVLAQLVAEAPVAAVRGDRFVVRDPSSGCTVGGGVVVDPFGPRRGRATAMRLAQLRALRHPDPAAALQALLEASPDGVRLDRFAAALNLRPDEADAVFEQVPMRWLASGDAPLAVSPARYGTLESAIVAALSERHVREPEELGIREAELLAAVGERLPATVARAVLAALLAAGTVLRAGPVLRMASHQPRLRADDAGLLAAVVPMLERAGLRAPIVGEIAEAIGSTRESLLERLDRLARLGHLVRVAPNRFFLPSTVDALADVARALAEECGAAGFDAAAYRDRSGIGRNLTIEVLEFLDRTGVTRFARGRRRMAPGRAPAPGQGAQ